MSEATETASTPLLEIDGARATIRLNRPKHLNRLQPDDLDALLRLFDRIEADAAIRVLVHCRCSDANPTDARRGRSWRCRSRWAAQDRVAAEAQT